MGRIKSAIASKITKLDLKDLLLIGLFGLNIYQHYQIQQLKKEVREYKELQEDFVRGIEHIVKKKATISRDYYKKVHEIDSLKYVNDSLSEDLGIINNRLYRLNKYYEKKYRIYDSASVNELENYFSRELFKN